MKVGRIVLSLAVLLAAVAAGWWAGREVFTTPQDPLAQAEPITYTVVEGTVGRSLRFAAVAEWVIAPVARSEAQGVITSVEVVDGEVVGPGEVLFTVGLRPVVVVEGEVPAFRDLGLRDQGPDVSQLQRYLVSAGFADTEPDGVFGISTRTAVRAWQRTLGVPDDGVVRLGDVIFVPRLPIRVALGETVERGRRIGGGEMAVWELPAAPSFWIPLSPDQRSLVPLNAPVRVTYGTAMWEAETVAAVEVEPFEGAGFSELRLILEAPGGGAVCGDECGEWVSVEVRSNFPAEIAVVPETTGPVVPVAAIQTDPGGGTFVTLASGGRAAVEVVAAHAGIAVVEGVDVGTILSLSFAAGEG